MACCCRIAFAFLFLLSAFTSQGQSKTLIYTNESGEILRQERLNSPVDIHQSLQKTYLGLIQMGYLNASLDTNSKDSALFVREFRGPLFTLSSLRVLTDSSGHSTPIGKIKGTQSFTRESLIVAAEKWIVENENKGYPFASLTIAELKIDSLQRTEVLLKPDRGPRILFDSLVLISNTKMPQRYVQGYINLRKGEYYDEEKLISIQSKLRELPFLQINRPSEVEFNRNKYNLRLYLSKKKANYFNGILGLRPDETSGKINFTGDLEVKLLNALNTGEEFYFNWRKLQPQTQDLTVNLSLPYLFSSPLGIDGKMKIYRRDSTFSSVKSALGIVLYLGGNDKLRLFIEKNNTSQLSTVLTAQTVGNVNSTLYGLSMEKEKLDYKWNPRKGFEVQVELATGMRNPASNTVVDNQAINISKRNVYRGEISSALFLPTWKKQTIRLGMMGGVLEAESTFDNEMLRIGGLRTIRGMNEESVFATSWAVASIEYRLLLETNSAVYLFADQSWYEKQGIRNFITDTPLGFGAGVNFETGVGIFTFNYALGTQFENPILLKNAKVSFGFRNVF